MSAVRDWLIGSGEDADAPSQPTILTCPRIDDQLPQGSSTDRPRVLPHCRGSAGLRSVPAKSFRTNSSGASSALASA
jgi:hypothetical protein